MPNPSHGANRAIRYICLSRMNLTYLSRATYPRLPVEQASNSSLRATGQLVGVGTRCARSDRIHTESANVPLTAQAGDPGDASAASSSTPRAPAPRPGCEPRQ